MNKLYSMRVIVLPMLFIVGLLLIWEFSVRAIEIPEYLLPPPSAIAASAYESWPVLLPHVIITLTESAFGFLVGSCVGFILAIMFTYSETLERGLYPYAIALKSVPIVAIAPLLTVWFGNGLLPKILVSALISFFPIIVNSVKGFKSVDAEALDLFRSLSASRVQVFLKLRFFSCVPYLFSALKMSSTLAVIGAIVGEFAGSDRGLGYFIVISSHRLETTDMFVGIILSSLLGIAFFYIIGLIEAIVAPWIRFTKEIY